MRKIMDISLIKKSKTVANEEGYLTNNYNTYLNYTNNIKKINQYATFYI